MNKDQIKGAAKEMAGKVQRKAGELVDSPEHEAKGATKENLGQAPDDEQMQRQGKTDQTKSNLKQARDQVKDAFRKD